MLGVALFLDPVHPGRLRRIRHGRCSRVESRLFERLEGVFEGHSHNHDDGSRRIVRYDYVRLQSREVFVHIWDALVYLQIT